MWKGFPMQINRSSKRSRGVVLVIVLVLFMALSGITLMTIEVSSRSAVEAVRVRSEYEAHFKAEEALFLIFDALRDDKTQFSDTSTDDWAKPIEDDGLSITIAPCNGRINLNSVARIQDVNRILSIMERVFPAGADVKRLVGSLGVWTGKRVNHTLEKLDTLFYASQYPSYRPAGVDLRTPDEVLLVNGWGEFDRQWINDTFTVWGVDGKININFASRDTLLAYFPKLGQRVDQLIHWRNTRGFTDLSQVLTVAGIEADSQLYKDMMEFLTVRSDDFEALVVAEVSGCRVLKRYIISRPSTFEIQRPTLVFQNDISVTFERNK
ncbi:general secretion pathway protein GspK [Maridesulfovibrio sp. FT414]|uniref:general secretion pathway protein GspK n=1 Tax=Maridesulfovibrio sp. FT414 TaxID=2979469 RepID=UPI003D80470B